MSTTRSDAAGAVDMTAPAEPIDGYEVWLVEDYGERFWYVADVGSSEDTVRALHVTEHHHLTHADDIRESDIEVRRATLADVIVTVPVEDVAFARMTILEAAQMQVADIRRGRHAPRCFVSTVW